MATARPQSLWQWMPTGTESLVDHGARDLGDFVGHACRRWCRRARPCSPRPRTAACNVLERVLRIGLPAVEEVLGVEDHLASRPAEEGDALGDHAPGFLRRRGRSTSATWKADALPTMVIVAGAGREQGVQAVVLSRAGVPCAASCRRRRPGRCRSASRASRWKYSAVLLVRGRDSPPRRSRNGGCRGGWVRSSLSWSEKLIPSAWEPSRRVVS